MEPSTISVCFPWEDVGKGVNYPVLGTYLKNMDMCVRTCERQWDVAVIRERIIGIYKYLNNKPWMPQEQKQRAQVSEQCRQILLLFEITAHSV